MTSSLKISFAVFSIDFVAQLCFRRVHHAVFLVLLGTYCGFLAASSLDRRTAPTVTVDTATVTGVAAGSVNEWLGIPFALPP
jgi:hypothetical protein